MAAPLAANASVAPDAALYSYVRARLADGASGLAIESYRMALAGDPASVDIARRSYAQALESGDIRLALQAGAILDQSGILPRDGTLLQLCDALNRKNWSEGTRLTDRMVEEGNFAFLAPIVRSWISLGQRRYEAPMVESKDRLGVLAARYSDEHLALQAIARGDKEQALPAMRQALAVRASDGGPLRLTFAAQLAAHGAKQDALALLPERDAAYAGARADIQRGRIARALKAPLTPSQGFGRLLARLAVDIAADPAGAVLGLRLARIATFADPDGAEVHIAAARLLVGAGQAEEAAAQARQVPANGWYAAFGQAELVEALAASGDEAGAIALARALATAPDAGADRHVRLGRLLADAQDFDGAAAAFRQAQQGYAAGTVPWALLLFEGSALEQGKRWEEARAVLEQAAAIAPDEPVVLNYLGYAQIERRQNVQAALGLLKKASALKPKDASITDSLGWAQFVTGDVKAAVPILERAAAGAPTDATINEHLGDALWAAGRRYEARYAWRAASTLAEGDVADRLAAKAKEGMKPEYAAP